MVFDARKRAEHSKRTREATAGTEKSTEVAQSSDPHGAVPAAEGHVAALAGKGVAEQRSPIVRSLLRIPRSQPRSVATSALELVPEGGAAGPATVILREDPAYPAVAKQHLISGAVEVHFRISPEGKVYDAKSVKGSPILARAAIEAVEARCYEPARLNGVPIDSQATTNFDFKLT